MHFNISTSSPTLTSDRCYFRVLSFRISRYFYHNSNSHLVPGLGFGRKHCKQWQIKVLISILNKTLRQKSDDKRDYQNEFPPSRTHFMFNPFLIAPAFTSQNMDRSTITPKIKWHQNQNYCTNKDKYRIKYRIELR